MTRIPQHLKDSPDKIAIGAFCVFAGSLLTAGAIVEKLYKKEGKHGLPACGFMHYKGKKYWWCRYGFVNDPDIYGGRNPFARPKNGTALSWPAKAAKKARMKSPAKI